MMTEDQIAHMEKRLDRDEQNVVDELWEADQRARFDAEVDAIVDVFEPPC